MTNFKKFASLLLAVLMSASVCVMAACDNGKTSDSGNDSSVSDSIDNSTNGGNSENDSEGGSDADCTEHVYSEDFVCITQPTCLEVGKKAIACVNCGAVKGDTADIAARGHDYGSNGKCIRCETSAPLPQPDANPTYLNPADSSSGISGSGLEYSRYDFSVDGYYEIELGRTKTMWANFAVPDKGQYALFSIENDGVSVKRYDASAQYIPIDENGNYIGHDAGELPNGNFISTVNCGELYWSPEWRATFCFTGDAGSTAKIHIVRIDDAAWQPGYVHVPVIAEQIDGHAPAGPEGALPTVVPYTTEYFYDYNEETDTGYYRMGTPENPGDLIYVAISSTAERMLLDKAFTQIQYEGNNLALDGGYNADGDHIVLDYAPFIMNDVDYGGTEQCYQNYVNSDGMYPVNQELFEFLNLYVQKNMPMDIPSEIWDDPVAREKSAWLAACYYYAVLPLGSAQNPYVITDNSFSVTTIEMDYQHYKINYLNQSSGAIASFVDIICENENARMLIGNQSYNGPFKVRIETNSNVGAQIMFASVDGSVVTYDVTLQDAGEGSMDYPLTLTPDAEGDVELQFTTVHMCDGSISYEMYYQYVAKKTGTLNFSTDADIYMLAVNTNADEATEEENDSTNPTNQDVYLDRNGEASMQVKAGDVISIYVSSKTADSVSLNIQ